jgi:RNA polymerase sigma-70 factor (ECF subfamily)
VTVQLQGASAGGTTTTTMFVGGDPRGCSDAALVLAYQTGHSEVALTTLIDRHQSVVMRTCQRVLGNWHDAEDVSQLVFLALAQGQFRLQSTLAGWLRTVARNASIVLLRARHRRQRHEQMASQGVEVHPDDTQKELREEIDIALKQLPANLREAVQLRYLDGWSQAEAAQMLGCPRGTLSQRAANGMQQLSDLLANRPTLAESYLY